MPEGQKTVATNRRARHDHDIEEVFEAGMVLTGPEVKSLRAGRASLMEAYGRVAGTEVWLEGMHVPPYAHADQRDYDPRRARKLLLHQREIQRLIGRTAERGFALVPMRVYFKRGRAKLELGLGRGKRKYEKRQDIAKREHEREIERGMARRRRGG